MSTCMLCPALRDTLGLSMLRWLFGPEWRFFLSDKGRWWAARGHSDGWWHPGVTHPDAVDADGPAELAAKIRSRPCS